MQQHEPMAFFYAFYSERSATTGSFLEAILEGIKPANNVSIILIAMSTMAATNGKLARIDASPVK